MTQRKVDLWNQVRALRSEGTGSSPLCGGCSSATKPSASLILTESKAHFVGLPSRFFPGCATLHGEIREACN